MLSYQHSYHAGNHADILKHFVLSYVMEYLNKKEKPYTFFDTHSASGVFDLLDNKSLKTSEAQNGIIKLINQISTRCASCTKKVEPRFFNLSSARAARARSAQISRGCDNRLVCFWIETRTID